MTIGRTEVQLALMAVGLVVWASGQRTDDSRLMIGGIAFFAVAFALRIAKKKPPRA
ncbi:MAG: hypothetical protein ABI205_01930 [Gemmatimonadaceae bacterium]